MNSVLVCLSLFYLTTVVATDSLLLTTAKVSYPSVSWNVGLQIPDCQLLGHGLVNTKLEDIRVQGVTGGENEYWIGAHVQYTKWIKLVGCYNTSVDDILSVHNNKSVLDCYHQCQGRDFGLSVKGCVCDIRADRTADACMATTCPGHSNDVCGTAHVTSGFTCLCFYKITNFPSGNEKRNCKVVASTGSGMHFLSIISADCTEEHGFFCKKGKSFYYDRKTLNWTEARLACIRRERRHVNNKSNTMGNPGLYWGSLFRKQISTWGDKTPQGTEFDCLAASVSGKGKLNPSVRKCDTKLPLLCDQPEQKQAQDQVEIEKNDSLSGNKVVCQGPNAFEPDTFDVFSLFVGAGCGILFTIIILISSVVIYKCRKKAANVPAPQNGQQDVGSSDTLAVHYEHLRPVEGCNVYDVCGQSSVSYDYISTQK